MSWGFLVACALPVALLVVAYLPLWADRFRFEAVPGFALCAAVGAGTGLVWLHWLDPGVVHALAGASSSSPVALAVGWFAVAFLLAVQLGALVLVARGGRFGALIDGALHGFAGGVGMAATIGAYLAWHRSLGVGAVAAIQPLGVATFCGTLLGLGAGATRVMGRLGARLGALVVPLFAAAGAAMALPALYPYDVLAHARSVALLGWYEPAAWAAGVAALAWVAWVEERRLVAGALAREAQLGVLPAGVVEVAANPARRMRAAWWPDPDERRVLNRLLTTLALRGVWVSQLPADRVAIYGLELGRLRERARTLLNPRPAAASDTDG
jgi:hypothetical protein